MEDWKETLFRRKGYTVIRISSIDDLKAKMKDMEDVEGLEVSDQPGPDIPDIHYKHKQ
jgi:hypothetical protein